MSRELDFEQQFKDYNMPHYFEDGQVLPAQDLNNIESAIWKVYCDNHSQIQEAKKNWLNSEDIGKAFQQIVLNGSDVGADKELIIIIQQNKAKTPPYDIKYMSKKNFLMANEQDTEENGVYFLPKKILSDGKEQLVFEKRVGPVDSSELPTFTWTQPDISDIAKQVVQSLNWIQEMTLDE